MPQAKHKSITTESLRATQPSARDQQSTIIHEIVAKAVLPSPDTWEGANGMALLAARITTMSPIERAVAAREMGDALKRDLRADLENSALVFGHLSEICRQALGQVSSGMGLA